MVPLLRRRSGWHREPCHDRTRTHSFKLQSDSLFRDPVDDSCKVARNPPMPAKRVCPFRAQPLSSRPRTHASSALTARPWLWQVQPLSSPGGVATLQPPLWSIALPEYPQGVDAAQLRPQTNPTDTVPSLRENSGAAPHNGLGLDSAHGGLDHRRARRGWIRPRRGPIPPSPSST